MRISTSILYEAGVGSMNRQQIELLKTQQQLASGKRILTAGDDPIAAGRTIEVRHAQSANQQYAANRREAMSRLAFAEMALGNLSNLIQNVKVLAAGAANPAMSDRDRASLAVELHAQLEELVALANMRDESGYFMFSGNRVNGQPFAATPAGVIYAGDQGTRLIQVSDSRQIAVSIPGSELFERIREGNGTFSARADYANAGSGVISAGSVADNAALTGASYAITFSVTGSTITYDVTDTTSGTPLSTGNAYVSGNAIVVAGMRVEVSGEPAHGDVFTLAPSRSRSLFSTIEELMQRLGDSTAGFAGGPRLMNGINTAMQNLDQALDHVLAVRAALGGRLKELDALHSTGETIDTQYQHTLSQLEDVDYAQAISRLTQQQLYLEAAQRSFMKVSGLTLFNYL
jgi:flagellar hook-associated protein 3 FlgL